MWLNKFMFMFCANGEGRCRRAWTVGRSSPFPLVVITFVSAFPPFLRHAEAAVLATTDSHQWTGSSDNMGLYSSAQEVAKTKDETCTHYALRINGCCLSFTSPLIPRDQCDHPPPSTLSPSVPYATTSITAHKPLVSLPSEFGTPYQYMYMYVFNLLKNTS